MRTVELFTTQNVTIEYELATLRQRALAAMLDCLIYGSSIFILITFFISWIGFDSPLSQFLLFAVIAPATSLYSLYSEVLMNGQTLGKKVLGIKVVKLSGDIPSFQDYMARWSVRFLEIWLTFGSLASLVSSSSPSGQRLGDMLAGTTVVQLRPGKVFELGDILKIQSSSQYSTTYPLVTEFSEKDMLLLKNALGRYNKFPNEAHTRALELLCAQVAQKLGLTNAPKDRVQFLRTVINDYIVLTR